MPVRPAVIALLALTVAPLAPPSIAADWADPTKVLRIAFPIDVSGLDPAGTQETYASVVEGRSSTHSHSRGQSRLSRRALPACARERRRRDKSRY